MIRFTWLRFRTQATVALGALMIAAVVLAVTGSQLAHALVIAVPGLIRMFWGAPLAAREFETGTFRLAWTQGITRTRWLAVKIGVVGVASRRADRPI